MKTLDLKISESSGNEGGNTEVLPDSCSVDSTRGTTTMRVLALLAAAALSSVVPGCAGTAAAKKPDAEPQTLPPCCRVTVNCADLCGDSATLSGDQVSDSTDVDDPDAGEPCHSDGDETVPEDEDSGDSESTEATAGEGTTDGDETDAEEGTTDGDETDAEEGTTDGDETDEGEAGGEETTPAAENESGGEETAQNDKIAMKNRPGDNETNAEQDKIEDGDETTIIVTPSTADIARFGATLQVETPVLTGAGNPVVLASLGGVGEWPLTSLTELEMGLGIGFWATEGKLSPLLNAHAFLMGGGDDLRFLLGPEGTALFVPGSNNLYRVVLQGGVEFALVDGVLVRIMGGMPVVSPLTRFTGPSVSAGVGIKW